MHAQHPVPKSAHSSAKIVVPLQQISLSSRDACNSADIVPWLAYPFSISTKRPCRQRASVTFWHGRLVQGSPVLWRSTARWHPTPSFGGSMHPSGQPQLRRSMRHRCSQHRSRMHREPGYSHTARLRPEDTDKHQQAVDQVHSMKVCR